MSTAIIPVEPKATLDRSRRTHTTRAAMREAYRQEQDRIQARYVENEAAMERLHRLAALLTNAQIYALAEAVESGRLKFERKQKQHPSFDMSEDSNERRTAATT